MKTSLHTRIRFTGLAVAGALLALALSASALGATGAPPQSAIDAASANWAAKAALLNVYGQPKVVVYPYSATIDAESANWAAKAKLLNAYGQPIARTVPNTTGGGLDWGDFGMGAAAMLGLLMLGSGAIAGAYYSRRGGAGRRAAL